MQDQALDAARATWDTIDANRVRDVGWLALPPIAQALDGLHARSNVRVKRVAEILRRRVAPEHRGKLQGAAIVCGDLESEKMLFSPNGEIQFAQVLGVDLSPASLDRIDASGFAVVKQCSDANDLRLEPQSLDLIVGVHGLHHVFNQGNLFYQIQKALKPNGLFYMEEWIGPTFLQFPKRNIFFARLCLWLGFSKHERTNHQGQVKGKWLQMKATEFDPSEACNSEEILPQFQKYLRPIQIHYYGGLLYPVFEGLAENFDTNRPWVRARIRAVIFAERWLQRLGLVKPLFVTAIAERDPNAIDPRRLPTPGPKSEVPLWKRIARVLIPSTPRAWARQLVARIRSRATPASAASSQLS